MLKAFETSVNLRNWDLGRRPTLLAVSGGVDSVAMARLFAMKGYPFAMAHVNFGLRGKESEGDEQFVRGLAKELGVEVFVERVDVGGYRRANGISVQMAARELRYSFFRRVMRERGFERLATGHHANDNLEHFFVYLYRGNTAVAWRGIWQEQGDVVRPLLGFLKSELEEFLVAGGWLWREDRSNGGVGYLRNKVRHFVMPGLDDFAKEFYGLSLRKQQTLRGWQAQQAGLWGEHCEERDGGLWVPSVYLALADEGYWMDRLMGMGFSLSQLKQARENHRAGAKYEGVDRTLWVGRGGWMVRGKVLESAVAHTLEWIDGGVMHWGGYRIETKKVALNGEGLLNGKLLESPDAYYFGLGIENKAWVVRGWVNGDRMEMFGGGAKKLSDVFVNEKVESFVKPFVPLVVGSMGVLCALGLKRSAGYPVLEGDSICWELRWERL